jgi:hypothetical protein
MSKNELQDSTKLFILRGKIKFFFVSVLGNNNNNNSTIFKVYGHDKCITRLTVSSEKILFSVAQFF